eukprot:CAMPEP_0117652572 /NCGR_PEP_ID=MMETSP0804-20121206/2699_1 /TAXON_ID=1074897 /ORGANISM="Tetraselmis astigmatica, Strain CCMP880" /LENGTH=397 /DNA_ID=CAMNT_0005458629 /DNA_START=387 /DNA_END=1576 /DNA_ORIENTATION=-
MAAKLESLAEGIVKSQDSDAILSSIQALKDEVTSVKSLLAAADSGSTLHARTRDVAFKLWNYCITHSNVLHVHTSSTKRSCPHHHERLQKHMKIGDGTLPGGSTAPEEMENQSEMCPTPLITGSDPLQAPNENNDDHSEGSFSARSPGAAGDVGMGKCLAVAASAGNEGKLEHSRNFQWQLELRTVASGLFLATTPPPSECSHSEQLENAFIVAHAFLKTGKIAHMCSRLEQADAFLQSAWDALEPWQAAGGGGPARGHHQQQQQQQQVSAVMGSGFMAGQGGLADGSLDCGVTAKSFEITVSRLRVAWDLAGAAATPQQRQQRCRELERQAADLAVSLVGRCKASSEHTVWGLRLAVLFHHRVRERAAPPKPGEGGRGGIGTAARGSGGSVGAGTG